MNAAILASAVTRRLRALSRLSSLLGIWVAALVNSRARDAQRERRRHQAFLEDLRRRQDHSPLFSIQRDFLPFRI